MGEPPHGAPAEPQPQGPERLQARLAALRRDGAWRLDPARFHYLEALARRLAGQPPAVQRLLQDSLQAALADYAQRLAQASPDVMAAVARPPGARSAQPRSDAAGTPLAQLNRYIRAARPAEAEDVAIDAGEGRAELPSVRRFRQSWSRRHAQDQVQRAAARRPANAGPLNSHMLVLQSLDLMRELSPDYLGRFLSQVESLQWLERARELHPPAQAKAGKPAKPPRRAPKKK